MSGTKKSDNANMNFSASENSSTQILATNTIIHHEKTYFIHHKYDNYAASKDGYIINCKRLVPRKGRLNLTGYFETAVRNKNGRKLYKSHRFIWQSINQKIIPEDYQIHHINNDKRDNCIENLELVTKQQNMIYEGKRKKGMKRISPQNVDIKCDKFYYHPIYTNFGANKFGQIYNKKTKRCSIGCICNSGYMKRTLNQIGLSPKKYFIIDLFMNVLMVILNQEWK